MDFALLQRRLLEHVRDRVRNGEFTERGLARHIGISQPHLHNLLKGARMPSVELADHLLHSLDLDLAWLLDASAGGCRFVPLMAQVAGPDSAPLDFSRIAGRYPAPAGALRDALDPHAVVLDADPGLPADFRGGDVLIVDRAYAARESLTPQAFYLTFMAGGTRVRQGVAIGSYIRYGGRNILDVVLAKVIWLARILE